jgi:hypothetical protein
VRITQTPAEAESVEAEEWYSFHHGYRVCCGSLKHSPVDGGAHSNGRSLVWQAMDESISCCEEDKGRSKANAEPEPKVAQDQVSPTGSLSGASMDTSSTSDGDAEGRIDTPMGD